MSISPHLLIQGRGILSKDIDLSGPAATLKVWGGSNQKGRREVAFEVRFLRSHLSSLRFEPSESLGVADGPFDNSHLPSNPRHESLAFLDRLSVESAPQLSLQLLPRPTRARVGFSFTFPSPSLPTPFALGHLLPRWSPIHNSQRFQRPRDKQISFLFNAHLVRLLSSPSEWRSSLQNTSCCERSPHRKRSPCSTSSSPYIQPLSSSSPPSHSSSSWPN